MGHRHTRPKPVYHIDVSDDGKHWTRAEHAPESRATDLYRAARALWHLTYSPTIRRPWVRIIREGSDRAVRLFSGGLFQHVEYGNWSEWRRVGP